MSGLSTEADFFTRWRNPALALICFLLAIFFFNLAAKLGCRCAATDFKAASVQTSKTPAVTAIWP